MQENILPSRAMVVLGSRTLPWSSFSSAAQNWSKHILCCCRLLSDSLPLLTKNLLLAFCAKLTKMSMVASSRIDSHLFDLLRSTRARKASDDRDKVYSVLGLVTTWLAATPIAPDYTLTTLQLYAQVTEHIITSMSGSLYVLACNHLCRPGIPSWVHDWAGEDHTDYPYETGWADIMWGMYNASSKVPATIKRHGDSILLVDGYYIDRVVATGDPMEVHDWKSSVPIWDSWTALTGVDKDPHKPYVTGGDIDNALWRCLVGNVAFNGQSADPQAFSYGTLTQEHYSAYEAWKKEIRTAVEGQWMLSMETAAVYMVAAITARHRRLFITEKGYLGMGALTTAVGDEVYVLLGSNVPFVTRTAAPPSDYGIKPLDLSIKTLTLIGECYLQGVMDGEILLDPKFRKETIALC